MCKKLIFISSFLVILEFVGGAYATTYYVSPTGSDPNPGTESRPFATIQKAADVMVGGDTCIVKDGTYTDTNSDGYVVDVRAFSGADKNNQVTFKAENVGGATLDGQENGTHVWSVCWYLYQASYVRLEGFKVTNCRVGIYNVSCHDIYIYRCEVYNIGRRYMWSFCEGSGSGPFVGITGRADNYNITVDRCKFYDIGRLYQTPVCVHDYKHDHALYLIGKNHIVKNNIIYNMYSGYAIKICNHDGPTAGPTHIITNNTFAHAKNDGPHSSGHIIIFPDQGPLQPHDMIIENNIFYNPPGTCAIGVRYSVNLNGNIFRNNVTSADDLWVFYGGTGSGAPTEANNTNGLALLLFGMTDPENNDFTLTSNALYLIDKGISTQTHSYDYDGAPRPIGGSYDIGAYELQGGVTLLSNPSPPTSNQKTPFNIDAGVKSSLTPRFRSVEGAAAWADSWFLQCFLDFWRLHQ